jgi:hypothetical protein
MVWGQGMSDFKKWFKSLNENGRVAYFLGQEGRISEEAWNHQQAIIDDLRSQQKRIGEALFEMRQLSLILSKDIDGYEDPAQVCQSEGVDMGVKILEKAMRGANETN